MRDEAHSLWGCRIVVTRAVQQSAALTALLQARGATVVACPVIEIGPPASWVELDRAIAALNSYDWLVFTSSNGVEFFLQRLAELGGELAHLRIGAVGPATAARLVQAGLPVTLLPQEFSARGFAAAFAKRYGAAAKGWRMLAPVSSLASDELRAALAAEGVQVDVVTAYENRLPMLSRGEVIAKLCEPHAQFLLFSSPSTVAHLARLLAPANLIELLPRTRIVCIGPATAAAAVAHGFATPLRPETATTEALLRLIRNEVQPLHGCSAAM